MYDSILHTLAKWYHEGMHATYRKINNIEVKNDDATGDSNYECFTENIIEFVGCMRKKYGKANQTERSS